KFLPAHLVNEMADLAVTQWRTGELFKQQFGQGTPVVGIGFQAEQQANIDGIAKAGMAIRIPLYEVNTRRIVKSVRKISSGRYKANAKKFRTG
ncbi:MAG: glycosyltransferase family 1 protein, partial [Chloroflexia bacterium]|nr:glycosyltransferase family 1 protein [Chloroflexia bacterium]